jgi:uncharacterized repeat protein (TIGR01451 family)
VLYQGSALTDLQSHAPLNGPTIASAVHYGTAGSQSLASMPPSTPSPNLTLGTGFEGLHYKDANQGVLPPDNGFAVGNGFVVEAVNLGEIRVTDMTGKTLLTEDMNTLFGLGVSNGGDIFVAYDDIASRWYVGELGITGGSYTGYEFAWSNDANPLDGFTSHFINLGYLLDFPKIGFNADDVVISGDSFGSTTYPVQIIAIDKSALLGGTFKSFLYNMTGYPTNWGLMPAKMHGSATGDPQYFIDEAGFGNGTHIRVWSATGLLTGTATLNPTDLLVNTYGQPVSAAQKGGSAIATNSAWLISADWRNNILVTAHNATTPGDGGTTTHAIWYEVSTSGTPSLMDQGVVSSGVGVHSYMPSAAVDANGDIGITYIESSSTEFMSMYVGVHAVGDPAGSTTTALARAGQSTLVDSSRSGDYSTTVVDPLNPNTFWASNEYSPTSSNTDIWATFTQSFAPAISGASLSVTVTGSSRMKEGAAITYTIKVTNAGSSDATNVVLTDTLGSLLNYLSATTSQGSFVEAGGVVTFTLGTVTAGSTATATVTAQATEDGSTSDSAVATADNASSASGSQNTKVSEPPIKVSLPITTTLTSLTNFKVASFGHANGVEAPSAFTATINWGDGGPTSTGTITKVGHSYRVFGSHNYSTGGSHTITTTVVENGTPPNTPTGDLGSQTLQALASVLAKQLPVQSGAVTLDSSNKDAASAIALDLYFNAPGLGVVPALPENSTLVLHGGAVGDFNGWLDELVGDLSGTLSNTL